MMTMPYETLMLDFKNNIYLGVKSALEYLHITNLGNVFAFAVNISDDLVNIDCCANSIQNINACDKWSFYSFDIWLRGKVPKLETAFLNAEEVSNKLSNEFFNFFTGDNYDRVRDDLIKAIINSIKKAKDSLDFDTSDITFFVTMMAENDADILITMENASAEQLNNNIICTNFKNRFFES